MVGVKALVDQGIHRIPDMYIKPKHQRSCATRVYESSSTEEEVPLIDLDGLVGPHRHAVVASVRNACENWGFFQVIGGAISSTLSKNMLKCVQQFFCLPLEQKMRYYSEDYTTKHIRYGTSVNPTKEESWDWIDYLQYRCYPDPEYKEWPINPPLYCHTAREFSEEVGKLAKLILSLISESLELDRDCLQKTFGNHLQVMKTNFYPPCPNPELAMGLRAHSDPGGITLLLQTSPEAETGLLQVLHGDCWMSVKPLPAAFVVNLGDQMQVLTNGRYKSVEHRVVASSHASRISIALFYNPSLDAHIAPLSNLIKGGCMYRESTFGEYLKYFYSSNVSLGKSHLQQFWLLKKTNAIIALKEEERKGGEKATNISGVEA